MSWLTPRAKKILLIVSASLVGLLLIAVVALLMVVRTAWFHDMVRGKIIAAIDESTGGRATIGRFDFEWNRLRAVLRDFTIHGREAAGQAPLFHAGLIEVDFSLASPFHHFVDLNYLLVQEPRANLIVYPDGSTNVPSPKVKSTSSTNTLQRVVDLAIGRFELRGGGATVADRKAGFDVQGQNLRAHLDFHSTESRYTGEIAISPLLLQSAGRQPVAVAVDLPVTLEQNRITISNGRFTTAQSNLMLSGSLADLASPNLSAHLKGSVALEELGRAAGLPVALHTGHGPQAIEADVSASMSGPRVQVENARITLGASTVLAAGVLRPGDQAGNGMRFQATLALQELGRLLGTEANPAGTVRASGTVRLSGNQDYAVQATVDGSNLAFTASGTRIQGVQLNTSVAANPNLLQLASLRVNVLGGSFQGGATVHQMEQFRVDGRVRDFKIERFAQAFLKKNLGLSGAATGPIDVEGSFARPSDVVVHADLSVDPPDVPLRGHVKLTYDGRSGNVAFAPSHLELPHTHIQISGSTGGRLQVHVASRDLRDFSQMPAIPVRLNGGTAVIDATVTGGLKTPHITGQLDLRNFTVENRRFDRLTAAVDLSPSGARLSQGELARGPMLAQFAANVGLRNWKPMPNGALQVDGTVRNAALSDVLALAGQPNLPVSGGLTADVHIAGTQGSPSGSAEVTVADGAIEGQHFDTLTARASMTGRAIDLPVLRLTAGASHIDASVTYQHSPDDLKQGTLHAQVASSQLPLESFQALVKNRPGLGGALTLNADVSGNLRSAPSGEQFQLVNFSATAAAHGLRLEGRQLGDLTATASTAASAVRFDVQSNLAGSTIRVNGETALAGDHQTSAQASISGLPLHPVLALAGQGATPVTGDLAVTARLTGTLDNPTVSADLNVTNGVFYAEKFNRLQATVNYTNQLVNVPSLLMVDGASQIRLTASLAHPAGNYRDGQARFQLSSNQMQLANFEAARNYAPGLAGRLEVSADGALTLRRNAAPLVSTLNLNVNARGVAVEGQTLGDLTATAETRNRQVDFHLTSNFAKAQIQGNGRMQLAADYPVNAQLTFSNVTYAGLSGWLGGGGKVPGLAASTAGEITLSGPVSRPNDLQGALRLTTLEAHAVNAPGGPPPRSKLQLHNQGDVLLALAHSVVTVRSFQLTGTGTSLTASGSAPLAGPQPVNLHVNGNIQLEVLQALSPDIFASGSVDLNAAATGSISKPVVNGRLDLRKASFNMVSLPNGIAEANGAVLFTGREAVIQNITAQSGGGKITLAGYVGYGGPGLQMRVTATANGVRVNYPESVLTEVNAKLTLAGTSSRSVLSGDVSIVDVALFSHTDVGSILAGASAPPSAPATGSGPLAGMQLDVRVRTAPAAQFHTTLTENLQADANLRLRGTPLEPGMLGRLTVTQGKVVFFGAQYTIDQGTVTFNNPRNIRPVLNVDLETQAQGVDVTISVSGPMDRLKMTYRSDPPMQFSDLISLLAAGKLTTTDPVLAARQPAPPQQSFEQQGASTLLGQAVANPISGRLQRLFGVSRISINPQIAGDTNTPGATLTIQQQVTRDISLTYSQDVTQTNPLGVRIEWDINRHWSAIAQRDIYGIFDLDFFYKKRFK